MYNPKLIKTFLCLVLALAMTFTPAISSYALYTADAGTVQQENEESADLPAASEETPEDADSDVTASGENAEKVTESSGDKSSDSSEDVSEGGNEAAADSTAQGKKPQQNLKNRLKSVQGLSMFMRIPG